MDPAPGRSRGPGGGGGSPCIGTPCPHLPTVDFANPIIADLSLVTITYNLFRCLACVQVGPPPEFPHPFHPTATPP